MNRDASQDESATGSRIHFRKARWLPALEQELKQRVGWADEAVSPFARRQRMRNVESEIRHAA
jgi:hypothetical protein